MIEEKHISKFFLALVKEGGQLSRTDLSIRVFGGNRTASKLDELLKAPTLCGLVITSRERIRGTGRKALRYVLTPAGWQVARIFKLPVSVDRISPEEVQHQFRLLVEDGHPWAKEMERDANLWRAHQETQKRLRAEKAEAEKERKRLHPESEPKLPKAPRHRSERDRSQRARFIQSKIQERQPLPHPPTPPSSPAASTPPVVPRAMRDSGPMGTGGFRQPTATASLPAVSSVAQRPQVRPRPAVSSDASYLSSEALAEIRKITAAGYRCNEKGEVLYDNKWISRAEWKKKMPGVLD